jgi:hypothetical protein
MDGGTEERREKREKLKIKNAKLKIILPEVLQSAQRKII